MLVKLQPGMHHFPSCYGPELVPWEPGPCQLLLDDDLLLGTVTCHNPGAQQLHGTFTPVWEAERFAELLQSVEQLRDRRLRLQAGEATFYPRDLQLTGDRVTWTAP